jgi:hypothetical protein
MSVLVSAISMSTCVHVARVVCGKLRVAWCMSQAEGCMLYVVCCLWQVQGCMLHVVRVRKGEDLTHARVAYPHAHPTRQL